MYRDPSVAIAPDPGWLCVLHVTAVLPAQGVGVFDTCLVGRIAVPAFWFLSIWIAKPPSTKNSENNSAAPIESRAEFLHIMHLLLIGSGDHCLAMLNSNQRARRSCLRLLHGYPLSLLDFSRVCCDGCRSKCLGNQPGSESNLIMMESEWMQTKNGIR